MARTKVQSELIATNAISGTIIADNAITATHIATNAISGTLVQSSGIVTDMIAANNVTAAKIVTNAIQTRHIADDQVTGDKLTNNITIAGTLTSTGAFTSPGIDDNADAVAITINSSENVGIGETSPTRRLSVRKDTGITSGFNDISEFLDSTLGAGGSISLNIGKAASNKNLGKVAFKWASNASTSNALNFGFFDADNLVTLLASGKLGIGTETPAYTLSVQGTEAELFNVTNTNTYGRMSLRGAANLGGDLIFREAGSSTAQFGIYSSGAQASSTLGIYPSDGSTPALLVKQNANVGIGTSNPLTGLHVVTAGGTTPFRVQGGANSGVNIMEVGYAGGSAGAVSYTHLTLPTTPYV